MKRRLIVVAAALIASSHLHGQVLKGVAALQGTAPTTDGFLKAAPAARPLTDNLDFWMTLHNSALPIKRYQVEMTKPIHVVIVSNDFKTFMHIHPVLSPTGHFTITQTFPAAGLYQVYIDGLPNDLNHQVFRFELPIGQAAQAAQTTARTLPSTGKGVRVGPYEVDMSTLRLKAGQMEMVNISIQQNGKPATDLHPYLGAPAHAVFLNAKDLTYVHVHPMAMDASMDMSKPMPDMPDNAKSSGEMMLMVNIKEAGSYKLWLQFRGAKGELYVAEFTIVAS